MRVSLGLPIHRVDAASEFVTGEAVAEISRAAESAGFSAVFVTDHPAPPERWVRGGGHVTTDPLLTLGFAAAATSTLHLQTNLFVPAYRHPLVAAKSVATLDLLSGGRVILGVGAGYLEPEFAALAADFEHRNDVLDDSLRTMLAAWSGDEVDGVATTPRPAQRSGPPVWIGGNSKRAIRRAVELGQGWVPMPSPAAAAAHLRTPGLESLDDLRARLDYLREQCASAGRDSSELDICFMPSGLDMFAKATPDASKIVDDISALAALGVTWVTVALPGDTRRDLLAQIDIFGRRVIRSAC
ncbi:MAG TPA: LLM class F420-dependent oxidoreductase [Mycobacteriales bacterium]|jgi:probable F420-dependent oxidoreductase|nr:LLM class F420-dependent oxidoreductase [Mycobacteriales bacterium]